MKQRLVVIGGGVVGLSIAWEALRRGMTVTVFDRDDLAGRASWAGAGILAPGNADNSAHPLDRMAGNSSQLHKKWSADLLAETGLSNGFLECSGVYAASSAGEVATLAAQMNLWQTEKIESSKLSRETIRELLGPEFQPATEIHSAWHVPSEMQICNTAHLIALAEAIEGRNGEIVRLDEATAETIELNLLPHADAVQKVSVGNSVFDCDHVCLAAGAWSGKIAAQLGFHLPTTPVRGQMLLFQLPQRAFIPIVNLGSRYIVPRADGRVLVGSTMEEVGFDATTTESALNELLELATSLFPVLNRQTLVRSWSGLRPASFDGMPYIGHLGNFSNLLVATGHMRSGLQLSSATADLVCDMIENRSIDHDLSRLMSPQRITSDN